MKINKTKNKKGEIRYYFSIYIGTDPNTGKRLRTNRSGFRTLQEAKKSYIELLENYKPQIRTSFLDVYKDWFEIYKLTVKPSTAFIVENRFKNHILPYFGKMQIKNINYRNLQNYVTEKAVNYTWYKTFVTHISTVIKHSIRLGIREDNPCTLLLYPKVQKEDKENVWTIKNLKEFLTHAKKELPLMWYTYFYLLIITGARKSEILALNWSDIVDDTITINKTLTFDLQGKYTIGSPKTRKSKRNVIVDDKAIQLLREWKIKQSKIYGISEVIFQNLSGDYITPNIVNYTLNKIINKYKLPKITAHGLRHTRTTILNQSGVRLKLISDILGHTNIKMTNQYNHTNIEEQREVIKNIKI